MAENANTNTNPRFEREVAKRLFAQEFKDSVPVEKQGNDQFEPKYVQTALGEKINRIFVVGVATEAEDVSNGEVMMRARVADPTGVFIVYAGQYQPEARDALRNLTIPAYVAIVGKAHTYAKGDQVYTSIRAENVNVVDEKTRDKWIRETVEVTKERIKNSKASDEKKKEYEKMVEAAQNAVSSAPAAAPTAK
jgi:RPA family protein